MVDGEVVADRPAEDLSTMVADVTEPGDAASVMDVVDAADVWPDILDLSDVSKEPPPDVPMEDIVSGPEIPVAPHGFRRLLAGPGFTILRGGGRRPLGWGAGLRRVFDDAPSEAATRVTTLGPDIDGFDFQFGTTFNCRQTYRMPRAGSYDRECWGDDTFRQLWGRRADAGAYARIELGAGQAGNYWLGHSFACARSTYCWGVTYLSRPEGNDPTRGGIVSSGINPITRVATNTAAHHACFYQPLPIDEVTCMGAGQYGELGVARVILVGNFDDRFRVSGINQVERLAVGPGVSYAVRFDGTVWCWGRCPNSSTWEPNSIRATARQVLGPRDIAEVVVAASDVANVCARTRDGRVRCWGSGSTLGLSRGIPVDYGYWELAEPRGVVELAAGDGHFCALTQREEVWCWGRNVDGAASPGGPIAAFPPTRVVLPN